ncbi:S-layer homology domain-containing protein [Leptothoe sp. PORK10 BA2]|uniref:S-layer homology domain-containing protein n=1 Tax=Leptothoe sp. PORK10 BA2 TaxID=3110254 RepID=UPI002B1FA8A7|nr:S-layer homology domain-containing protein [Leptothoe sp. PORK10 BA2]MEA5466642.1 S-layer homology domain-containing protein [Leptothoe sp. PORK10 BA2]
MIKVKALFQMAFVVPLLAPLLAMPLAAQPASQPASQSASQSARFRDTQEYWASACIDGMVHQGIMQGYPDGSFRPNGTLTRAELAAVIVKAYPNAPKVNNAPTFVDVPSGFWAAIAIRQAYERGFLAGYPNRQFQPNQVLTKAQAVTILAKAQKVAMPADTEDTLIRYFDDAASIPDYARGAIAAATQANLVVNYPTLRTLKPTAAISRGEVAALLCQANAASLNPQYRVPAQYVVQFQSGDNSIWQQATLLKEFTPHNQVDPLDNIALLQNQLFFFAEASRRTALPNAGNHVLAASGGLWVTDGTATGTRLVNDQILKVDVNGQPQSSFPTFMGASAQRVWFTTEPLQPNDLINRLWSSDGTTTGTKALAALSPELNQALSQASRLDTQPNLFLNENYVFSLTTPTETQLWQSDGQNNTQALGQFKHQPPQGGLIPNLFTSNGRQLFFALRDAQSTTQLWRSDGRPNGAIALQTLNPAGEPFTPWQDHIYVQAETPQAGWEFWTSDGTPSGTVLLKDIYPGAESSAPRLLTGLGSTFFALANSPQGFELWSTQGTSASTRLVKRLSAQQSSNAERTFFVHQGRLFFSFLGPAPVAGERSFGSGHELWVTDGTDAGTKRLAIFSNGNVDRFTVFKDRLFFSGGGLNGQELWRTDGTPQGTQQVADLSPGTSLIAPPCMPPNPQNPTPNCPLPFEQQNSSLPRDLTVHGDWLYFIANNSELYRTDGTTEGTVRVKRFANTNSTRPNRIVKLNQQLVIITEIPTDEASSIQSNRLQIWSLK